jgi:hypothetical protein
LNVLYWKLVLDPFEVSESDRVQIAFARVAAPVAQMMVSAEIVGDHRETYKFEQQPVWLSSPQEFCRV